MHFEMAKKRLPATDDEGTAYVTVRIPRELYEEVIELSPMFESQARALKPSGKVSRAMALRLTLLRGIEAVRSRRK